MTNIPTQIAPFPIVGTAGTDSAGATASVSISTTGVNYTAHGDTLLIATLALARELVELGFDPSTPLTVGSVSLARIDQAI